MTGRASPIKAVLFDKDGTLLDFQRSWGPWAALVIRRMCGADDLLETRVAETLGFDLRTAQFLPGSPAIAGTPDDVIPLLSPLFPDASEAELLAWLAVHPGDFAPAMLDGVAETCRLLRAQGIMLGLVTNDFEAAAKEHLATMGLAEYFATVIGYDSGFGGKPAPGPCLGAAAALGVAPEACVMVGDSLHDMHAGRAAGMICVAVSSGLVADAVLAPSSDAVLPGVAELPEWLRQKGALLVT